MMKMRALPIAVAAVALAAGARAQAPNFSNYVALGDSLTAGYESGCLVERHQLHSYPSQLATAFGTTVAGVGDEAPTHFQQPLVSEPGIPACLQATFDPSTGGINIGPDSSALGTLDNLDFPAPYNNLGIPGAEVADLLLTSTNPNPDPSSLTYNPYFDIVLRNQNGSTFTAVEEAISRSPTFVTVWIGNNDVLGAATIGIAVSPGCGLVNGIAGNPCDGVTITSVDAFTQSYTTLMQTLRAELPNATIVVVNIPNVTAIPFATTLPPVVFNPATLQPILDPSGQTIPLIGQLADGSVGPLPSDTLVTLKASALLAQGVGIPCAVYMATGGPANACVGQEPTTGEVNPNGQPLPDGTVTVSASGVSVSPGVLLTSDEVAVLNGHVTAYNQAIATAASAVNAKVYDVNTTFANLKATGATYAGVHLTTDFLTGGIFAYDGVHPSNIGYTIFTDDLVQYLNATFGTSLPRPNVYAALFEPDVPPPSSSATPVSPLVQRLSLIQSPLFWDQALRPFTLKSSLAGASSGRGGVAPAPVRSIRPPGNTPAGTIGSLPGR